MINIDDIKQINDAGALRWTNHVLVRLLQRGITTDDVVCALQSGAIIEQYPTDYPYPSCLVLGCSVNNSNIHVVCGLGVDELWLITVYYPNPDELTADFKVRKESKQ